MVYGYVDAINKPVKGRDLATILGCSEADVEKMVDDGVPNNDGSDSRTFAISDVVRWRENQAFMKGQNFSYAARESGDEADRLAGLYRAGAGAGEADIYKIGKHAGYAAAVEDLVAVTGRQTSKQWLETIATMKATNAGLVAAPTERTERLVRAKRQRTKPLTTARFLNMRNDLADELDVSTEQMDIIMAMLTLDGLTIVEAISVDPNYFIGDQGDLYELIRRRSHTCDDPGQFETDLYNHLCWVIRGWRRS